MLLAALLWWCEDKWQAVATRTQDMPGPSPAFTLAMVINWPVALIRSLWYGHVHGHWDYYWDKAVCVAAIGLFWYGVARGLENLRKTGIVLMFRWMPLRFAGDVILVGAGVIFGLLVASRLIEGPLVYFPQVVPPWLYSVAILAAELAWSVSLIFLFGRDAIRCVAAAAPRAHSTTLRH
jgi:hypothetical protein